MPEARAQTRAAIRQPSVMRASPRSPRRGPKTDFEHDPRSHSQPSRPWPPGSHRIHGGSRTRGPGPLRRGRSRHGAPQEQLRRPHLAGYVVRLWFRRREAFRSTLRATSPEPSGQGHRCGSELPAGEAPARGPADRLSQTIYRGNAPFSFPTIEMHGDVDRGLDGGPDGRFG